MLKWFAYHYDPQFHYCISIEDSEWELYKPVMETYFRNVNYLRLENDKGSSHARNKLCEYAQNLGNRFILQSDDDGFFKIEKVPEFMKAMEDNDHIIWMGGFFSGHTFYDKELQKAKDRGDLFYKPIAAPVVYGLRLSYWNLEKFDENIFNSDDLDYWLRMRKVLYPYVPIYTYLPFPVRKTRHSPGGHMVWKTNKDRVEKDVDYINKKCGMEVVSVSPSKKHEGVLIFKTQWKKYEKFLDSLAEEARSFDEQI